MAQFSTGKIFTGEKYAIWECKSRDEKTESIIATASAGSISKSKSLFETFLDL